jgi:hypothetical protein
MRAAIEAWMTHPATHGDVIFIILVMLEIVVVIGALNAVGSAHGCDDKSERRH